MARGADAEAAEAVWQTLGATRQTTRVTADERHICTRIYMWCMTSCLPPFDPAKVALAPHEDEIRAFIKESRKEREQKQEDEWKPKADSFWPM
jgi:hypothetical protein